jgi:1,2-diacylglycerol 3-alpha-glucosyltransferase
MAGGCPIVAVRASGVHDLVKEGYNGLMVTESTDSWAKAVASLLVDHQRLSFLSINSRTFSEAYVEEKIAEKVLRLYRRVIVLGKSKNG